jgi:Tfp pilus assembly protein PilV
MALYIETLISFVVLCIVLWGMMKFILKDIHKDLKEGMKAQDKRIDHLYQICVEMLGMRHKH